MVLLDIPKPNNCKECDLRSTDNSGYSYCSAFFGKPLNHDIESEIADFCIIKGEYKDNMETVTDMTDKEAVKQLQQIIDVSLITERGEKEIDEFDRDAIKVGISAIIDRNKDKDKFEKVEYYKGDRSFIKDIKNENEKSNDIVLEVIDDNMWILDMHGYISLIKTYDNILIGKSCENYDELIDEIVSLLNNK